jgi:tripartite-type tricarboxylate transporter receptor subunit TctC
MHRRTLMSLCGFAAATPLLPSAPASAQPAWPARPVTVLVPFVAGGASDIAARAIATRMQQSVGKPVVVENRPGANGEVAGRQFARSAPDGHTLMVGSIGVFAINPALRPNLGYDPVKQFAPVTLAVTTPNVLVVNPRSVDATDLARFIEWLKANRGKAAYSTSGIGSSDHLTAELFKQLTGTDPQHVPYTGGAQAITALMSDDVQLSFQNLGSVLPHVQEGRLRAIIVTAAERHPQLPQVPTAAEAGLRDFVVTSWQAMMAPAGTPQPLVARIHEEAAKALRDAETTQRLEQIGFTVVAGTPEEYSAFQRAEIDRWRSVIEKGGIKPE